MNLPTTTIESIYVVDTHALIWYLTNDTKLGATALTIFQSAERRETVIIISAVVIAELYYWNQKNKQFDDFKKLYQNLRTRTYFEFVEFLPEHVLDFDQDVSVPEMHNRLITGVARRFNAPLITRDPLIVNAKIVRVVW
jgi:PIN domain nuclease of toxin-antitoxin system